MKISCRLEFEYETEREAKAVAKAVEVITISQRQQTEHPIMLSTVHREKKRNSRSYSNLSQILGSLACPILENQRFSMQ